MSKKRLLLLAIGYGVLLLFACRPESGEQTPVYELGYKDYLKSSNFVYIHGETADSSKLSEDKYIEDNLDYLLQRHDWVLVNFSAYWCKDCRRFDPAFKTISQMPEYKNIIFAYAEVDGTKGNQNFRTRFNLPGVPVTILFHNGETPEQAGQPAILFGQRGDKTQADLLDLLKAFYTL